MFELQILFGNVVVPICLVLIGCLPLAFPHRSASSLVVPCNIAVFSGLAIWAALATRTGFTWPEDAWQKVPVAAMLVTSVSIISELIQSQFARKQQASSAVPAGSGADWLEPRRSSSGLIRWAVIAVAVVAAAWLIYPRGETWAELQAQQFQWCMVIALAASLGWWGIHGCKPFMASMVGLAIIPLLIASAFLTSLSIMKVTEPLIAIATVIGLCSLIDLRLIGRRSLPLVIAPTLFAMSGFIAHANFQSYLNLPRTLYFLAMLSPAIIALIARMSQRKSTRFAVGLTVGLAFLLAIAIGSWAFIAGDVGTEFGTSEGW